MTWIYSTDGTTELNRYRDLPAQHWVQTSADPPQGHYVELTPVNANSLGYFEVLPDVGTDGGAGWRLGPIANIAPTQWARTWTFDAAVEATDIDQVDRDADSLALKDDLQNAKDVRDAAVQSRTDMDHETPDPAALAKWAPAAEDNLGGVDRTGNQASQITALQDRVDELTTRQRDSARLANDLRIEMRRMYGDIRLISAMLVRKFRKDRDDQ